MSRSSDSKDLRVRILAAGKNERWKRSRLSTDPTRKHHLLVGGHTIIARQILQLSKRKLRPRVFSDKTVGKWKKKVTHETSCTLETMFLAITPHCHRNIILLGDVIFSNEALDKILADERPIVFAGNDLEFFAFAFDTKHYAEIQSAILRTFTHLGTGKVAGKLRCLHYLLRKGWFQGYDGDYYTRRESPLFLPIDDWTNDIDSRKDYERFINKVVKRGRLDEP